MILRSGPPLAEFSEDRFENGRPGYWERWCKCTDRTCRTVCLNVMSVIMIPDREMLSITRTRCIFERIRHWLDSILFKIWTVSYPVLGIYTCTWYRFSLIVLTVRDNLFLEWNNLFMIVLPTVFTCESDICIFIRMHTGNGVGTSSLFLEIR